MDPELRALLDELHQSGLRNDAETTDRAGRMLNITPETGELLRLLVVAGNARRVLELGTSNGYSTLWLADGARRVGGRVVTVERDAAKHALAGENLRRAGLADVVEARLGDIGAALPGLSGFDLVFLDAERTEYPAWWAGVQPCSGRYGRAGCWWSTTRRRTRPRWRRSPRPSRGRPGSAACWCRWGTASCSC